jgi:hypothetical protein
VLVSYAATHNADLTTGDLRLKAAAPLVRGDAFGIALLAGYGLTHLDLATEALDRQLTLHRFEGTLGGGVGLAPGWSLRGSFAIAHASDLRDTTWSALQVTSSAMVHRVIGPSDAVIAGAVYTSSAEFLPLLPILGYVHQREGSPLRVDVFLPHHARVEYELRPRLRTALGVETAGNTWIVHSGSSELRARRAGGAVFGEIQLGATRLVTFEARVGLSVDRYTFPTELDGGLRNHGLRAAGIAQLAVVIAP